MANLCSKNGSMQECTNARMQTARRALVHCCVFAFLSALLSAQGDRTRAEALARRATDRMQALQREADRLASDERTLIGDLRRLEIDRQLKAEQLKQIDADAA